MGMNENGDVVKNVLQSGNGFRVYIYDCQYLK